ncbi:MAG: haloacid dehalogenase domain protein hydrolase [Segetibacter sp.]|jgi:phosphoglycolate phosphatase|nr:haloacid dehalogenase domain protein hydrolase [Segetibacter sp.]
MKVENVLFDLDGTVIDSYSGIQGAFDFAYSKIYGKENHVSIKSIIGPPIGQILAKLNNEKDTARIENFVDLFKKQYDTNDYKQSTLYDGIKEVLERLSKANVKLYIATNKRFSATSLILDYLSVSGYFAGVYCNDSRNPIYSCKEEMVAEIIRNEVLEIDSTILVGDTFQDQEAAKHNKVKFIYASYGFGNLQNVEWQVNKPIEVLNFIK